MKKQVLMGSDELGYGPSPYPKLSLFSLPGKLHESSTEMLTPIHTLASVPFKWEEAPGKPRPSCMTQSDKLEIARCLELPPRLLNEARVSNEVPSPTTVLDGPYVLRSLSLGKGRSFSSSENLGRKVNAKERAVFSSSRWVSFNKNDNQVVDHSHGGETKVKITRTGRRSGFFGFSHTGSRLWTNIRENLENVVPWRRR